MVRLLSLSRSTLGGCGFRLALGGLKRGHDFRLAWPWVSDQVSSYGFPVGVGRSEERRVGKECW